MDRSDAPPHYYRAPSGSSEANDPQYASSRASVDSQATLLGKAPTPHNDGEAAPLYDAPSDAKDDLANESPMTVDGFFYHIERINYDIKTVRDNIGGIDFLAHTIKTLPPTTSIYEDRQQPMLQALADLTTSTSSLLETLPTQIRKMTSKAGYLRGRSGRVFVMAQEAGRVNVELNEALIQLKRCLELIREGAYREEHARVETRLRTAKRIRSHNPDMTDEEVLRLLVAAESNGREPVGTLDIHTYKGRWALENPFTELLAVFHPVDLTFLDAPIIAKWVPDSQASNWINPMNYIRRIGGSPATGYAAPRDKIPVDGRESSWAAEQEADEEAMTGLKSQGRHTVLWLVAFFVFIIALIVTGVILGHKHSSSDGASSQPTTLVVDVPQPTHP